MVALFVLMSVAASIVILLELVCRGAHRFNDIVGCACGALRVLTDAMLRGLIESVIAGGRLLESRCRGKWLLDFIMRLCKMIESLRHSLEQQRRCFVLDGLLLLRTTSSCIILIRLLLRLLLGFHHSVALFEGIIAAIFDILNQIIWALIAFIEIWVINGSYFACPDLIPFLIFVQD